MPLKVPFLADSHLESAATELLRKYAKWKGAPPRPPIPVDDIVEGLLELSLSVGDLRARLGKNDVLGATWLDEGHVMIDSSLEGNEGRFSFTLAHEAGHWVLHRPIIEMEKVTVPLFAREPNAKATPAIICRDGQRDSAEIQADRFAAYLLMPATDVRAAAKAVTGEPLAIDRLEVRRKGKRLAWRIQELAEGGLPASALERIGQLGDNLPERWRMRQAAQEKDAGPVQPLEPRDPRVPQVGTVLRRVFNGVAHEVTVCSEGFEHAGERFKTLSAVAKHITGTPWNGFLFFGLKKRIAIASEESVG